MSIFNATAPSSGGGEIKTATASLSTSSTTLNFNGNIGELVTIQPSWWVLVNHTTTQSARTLCYADSDGNNAVTGTNYQIADNSGTYTVTASVSSGYLSISRQASAQGSFFGKYILYYTE